MSSFFRRAKGIIRGTIEPPSVSEVVIRCSHAALFWFHLRTHRSDHATLHCYPDKPLPFYTLWPVSRAAGYRLQKGVGQSTLLFTDTEVVDVNSLPPGHESWINGRCIDISKNTVARVYEEVFGNTFRIDPIRYQGRAVRKCDVGNGMHDGVIVECPLKSIDSGYAYQLLIDNEIPNKGVVEDLRVTVVGRHIALVYIKRRPTRIRFANSNTSVQVVDAEKVFSQQEIADIVRFAHEMGLDFGDLDILRDQGSKKIYIVDVNTTSVTPPSNMSYADRLAAVKKTSSYFRELCH